MKYFSLCVTLLLGFSLPLQAKTIRINTTIDTHTQNDELVAQIAIKNLGDEPAMNSQVRAEWPGTTLDGKVHGVLPPAQGFTESLRLPLRGKKSGRYPLLSKVRYADANLGIWGTMVQSTLRRTGTLKRSLKNLESTPKVAKIKLLLPDELTAEPPMREIALADREEKTTSFRMKNLTALPASNIVVYALIDYEHGGIPIATLVSGMVMIQDSTLDQTDWRYLWIGLTAGLLVACLILLRIYLARRSPKTR